MTKNNEEMTDKQITKEEEGKECAFYANGKCLCSDFCLASYCADAPLCIYKQWLRKEQECERLKEENEQLKNNDVFSVRYFKDQNDNLKQTLTEIKKFCIDHTQLIHAAYPYLNIILEKINEVEDEKNNS